MPRQLSVLSPEAAGVFALLWMPMPFVRRVEASFASAGKLQTTGFRRFFRKIFRKYRRGVSDRLDVDF